MVINESVQVLASRLPELAWRLGALYSVFSPKLFPAGLFNYQFEMTPQSCIDEIKADLRVLAQQNNERSSRYLADRVNQKITVLVQLCRIREDKPRPEKSLTFSVQAINTRQQWLQTLQDNITTLETQQQALTVTSRNLQKGGDPQAILSIQAQLGEVERCLTLAKDVLVRAIS
jgi:hypothetical protein